MKMSHGVFIVPDFFEETATMRAEFEAAVGPDRTASPRRCCWDYWYVPRQFGYIRTFARSFFSPQVYRAFGTALSRWAESHLGCSAWTEPWLSYYVDGCRQEFHSDVRHGPWAWVFSLTHWERRRFSGGETVLFSAPVLDYWRTIDPEQASEADQLLCRVAPVFNQLIVFDGRVPHAVAAVEGTRDPLDSRVVLHGWFLPPQLRTAGALAAAEAEPGANSMIAEWHGARTACGRVNGVLTVRVHVAAAGGVASAEVIATTFVSLDGDKTAASSAIELALATARNARFPCGQGATIVTVPFTATDR